MARPKTKEELLDTAEAQYTKLLDLIDSMSAEERSAVFDFGPDATGKEAHWSRDRNLRDVIAHLHEWHELLLNWVAANESGDEQPFLPAPYNWRTYGDMNVEFWRKHQKTSYEEAMRLVHHSHEKAIALIDAHTNEELFSKGHFSWTGTTTLGSYCVSATSSHYDWAMKKIREHLRIRRS